MLDFLPKLKMTANPLQFKFISTCKTTKARVGRITLGRHHTSRGPIETQETLKGVTSEQLHQLNRRNIDYLGHRVVSFD